MRLAGFAGPAYRSQSKIAAADQCINLYPETIETTGQKVLYGTPGLQLHCTLPKSPVRALWAGDNRLFAVALDTLYEVFADGTYAVVGAISNDVGPATIVSNGNQLAIQSGTFLWVSNGGAPTMPAFPPFSGTVSTNSTSVTWVDGDQFDPSFVGAIDINGVPYTVASVTNPTNLVLTATAGFQTAVPYLVGTPTAVLASALCYLDGYFIILEPNSNKVRVSDPLNGLSWHELDFAIRLGGQDRLVTIFADHEELWLLGQKTTEVWYNSGNAGFPFEPIEGAFIDEGIIAKDSVAKVAGAILWLGGDDRGVGWVMAATGYQPKRVSTFAVEYAISTYSTITDAVAYTYTEKGHSFYVLTFPTANATWVYDVTENAWHQRCEGSTNNQSIGRYHATTFGGVHFVGSGTTGRIYKQSISYYADDGATIRRLRTAPHVVDGLKWLFYRRLELQMQMGLVPGSGPGSAPVVSLEVSSDGGNTFGAPLTVAAGAAGQFTRRAIWRRLGRARDRVFRFTMTEPIECAWIDAFLGVDAGDGS